MIGLGALRLTARLLPACVAVTVAGCGDGERPREPERESGRLVVQKSLADHPIFIEGSVTHLRISGETGAEIVDGLAPVETLDAPLLDRPVPAGAYRVVAVERPCQGNCGTLDPPVDATRCELEVTVDAAGTTRVAIVLGYAADAPETDCSAAPAAR